MRAGLDDVGLGALFGLYDYRFEVGAPAMLLAFSAPPPPHRHYTPLARLT